MKRRGKLVVWLLCLSLVFLWGCRSKSPLTVSFEDAIGDPESYLYQSAVFTDGVVIFHTVEKGLSIAIVSPLPLPKIDAQQIESQVIAITLPNSVEVNIGDVLQVKGRLRKIAREDKVIHYVDANSVEITEKIKTQDPDFEEIVQAITEEYKRERDTWFLFFLVFILLNPANPASPLFYGP